jgi:photosystem II stability/assembly factor-like uncharacterized protein
MKHRNHKTFLIFIVLSIFTLLLTYILFNKSDKYNEKEEEEASDALVSLQWMSQIRAFPNTDIPPDKFYKAFEYSNTELQALNDRDDFDQWTSIGPNNIGGRSLCVAVHPVDTATVFIGSASGGLWKSTTGGIGASAWTYVNTGFPSSAVSSIAIDSANPNVMYIGTGENYGYQYSNYGLDIRVTRGMYGIGILKTTDGGNIWTKALDWSYNNERGVWKVLINPKNSNVLYTATSEGVYKSVDAGTSWTHVLNYLMAMDLLINPVDTTILYVSIGDLSNDVPNANVGLYKTSNGGLNWTKLSDGLPSTWSGKATLQMYKGNPNYIYANIANDVTSYIGYYKSTNAGLNWTVGSTSIRSGNQGWYNQGHIVKSNDPNFILLGTLNVEKSTNGGTSFTTKSDWMGWIDGATPPGQPEGPSDFVHADVHSYTDNPKDPNKIYIAADGGLYRSNNFGETFYSCNGGYVTSQFYASLGNAYNDSIFCIGGMQDNRSAFYQGTTAWYKTFTGDGACSQVNSQNKSICYTEYTYGAISSSLDGGVNWDGPAQGPPDNRNSSSYCFNMPYVVCPSNPNILYAGGIYMYKSTNGGADWSGALVSFGAGKALSIAVSSTSTDTAYVGVLPVGTSVAAVYRTVNGGVNWTDVSNGSIPNRYPTRINVNPYNSKEVYVSFGGFGTAHILKSTNAGNSWQNITGNLPDIPTHSVCIDPVYNNIYVGNDLGVYVTTNGGTNWYEYRTGMPYAIVNDITIVNLSRKLRIATHGNGIWERKLISSPVVIQNQITKTPTEYKLYQNYPNPFNPVTNIRYAIPKSGFISLKVYDILGKEVGLYINEFQQAGEYNIYFDGSRLASGMYIYRLSSGGKTLAVKKMILAK